jgi:phosphoribosylamine--glycine ligase
MYAGLMIMPDGVPKVLEFNCRCGDPETQPIMMRLRSDLALACLDVIEGRGERVRLDWDPRTAVGVVMASGGYPGSHATGHAISGLDGADPEGVKVFHAGTTREDGAIVNTGGRVLCVVGLGDTVASAQRAAYARVETIGWQDAFYRRDIGHRAIARDAG